MKEIEEIEGIEQVKQIKKTLVIRLFQTNAVT